MVASIHNLTVVSERSRLPIVEDVSIDVPGGSLTALVGASGEGKSTILLALLDLLDGGRRRTAGRFDLEGVDVWAQSASELRALRGDRMAWVPQAPADALAPAMRIVDQVAEAIAAHREVSSLEARRRAELVLRAYGVPPDRIRAFPHQLSGGQRQRSLVAMAMALRPALLLADEPTTALDGAATHVVLGLLQRAAREGAGVLWVTHEIDWVRAYADRVAFLRRGEIAWVADREAALERRDDAEWQRFIAP